MSKNFQTAAELAVLADIEKQTAAGGDPFGDNEQIDPPSIAADALKAKEKLDEENGVAAVDEGTAAEPAAAAAVTDESAAAAGTEADATAATGDTQAAADAAVDEPVAETLVAPPPNIDPVKLNTERARLMGEDAADFKKVMDGEMTPEAYTAAKMQRQDQLDVLLSQRVKLETYAETRGNEEKAAIGDLMVQSAKKGAAIDYNTDPAAPAQFDLAYNMLLADPANARRPLANIVAEAHKVVLVLRGIKAPAATTAAPAPPAPAVARVPGKPPVTLRNIPVASTPNASSDLAAELGKLKGADFEAAYSRLTPKQKAALLDE